MTPMSNAPRIDSFGSRSRRNRIAASTQCDGSAPSLAQRAASSASMATRCRLSPPASRTTTSNVNARAGSARTDIARSFIDRAPARALLPHPLSIADCPSGTKAPLRRSNTASVKRYYGRDNERKCHHTATTLSPRILLRCGEGRQESRACQLSAPPLTGASRENVAALSDAPLAIFLDVDGTPLDLAERPDGVVWSGGLVGMLARTERKLGGALALISGRSIGDLDRLFE